MLPSGVNRDRVSVRLIVEDSDKIVFCSLLVIISLVSVIEEIVLDIFSILVVLVKSVVVEVLDFPSLVETGRVNVELILVETESVVDKIFVIVELLPVLVIISLVSIIEEVELEIISGIEAELVVLVIISLVVKG